MSGRGTGLARCDGGLAANGLTVPATIAPTPLTIAERDASGYGRFVGVYAAAGTTGVGSALLVGGGAGATPGTNLAGDARIDLGTLVANQSATFSLLASGSSFLDVVRDSTASGAFVSSSSRIYVGSPIVAFLVAASSSSNKWLDYNASQSNAVTIGGTGAPVFFGNAAVTFPNTLTTPTLRFAARTSDAVTSAFPIEGQAAFATATGANRKSGDVVVLTPPTTNGGAATMTPAGLSHRFEVTGASAALNRVDEVGDTVTTADATVTTALLYTLADASIYVLEVFVTARKASTGDSAAYNRIVGAKRHGGAGAALVGAVATPFTGEDAGAAAWDATIDMNGNDARVRVTGAAASSIVWTVVLRAYRNTP